MKSIYSFAVAALFCFTIASCGDDDKKKDDPQPTPINPAQTAKIDGAWHLYLIRTIQTDANGNIMSTRDENYDKSQSTQTFTPPSTYYSSINGLSGTATYKLKQDSLILTSASTTVRAKIDSLTPSRLVYTRTYNVSGIKHTVIAKSTR